jgi:hypothetical protein
MVFLKQRFGVHLVSLTAASGSREARQHGAQRSRQSTLSHNLVSYLFRLFAQFISFALQS